MTKCKECNGTSVYIDGDNRRLECPACINGCLPWVEESTLPQLIKIDPDNPPTYKKQLLFFDERFKVFRLGEVDYVREDDSGRTVIYKRFEDVKSRNIETEETYLHYFKPSHYLDLDLSEVINSLNKSAE